MESNQRIDIERVREQAKKIMDEFMAALDNEGQAEPDFGEEREVSIRHGLDKKADSEFRKSMFRNAPKKSDDYIIAEKKKW